VAEPLVGLSESEPVAVGASLRVLLVRAGTPVPVGRATPEDAVPTGTDEETAPAASTVKLAHEIRVLLDRCTTNERLPK
jgi:hypothetical protein